MYILHYTQHISDYNIMVCDECGYEAGKHPLHIFTSFKMSYHNNEFRYICTDPMASVAIIHEELLTVSN